MRYQYSGNNEQQSKGRVGGGAKGIYDEFGLANFTLTQLQTPLPKLLTGRRHRLLVGVLNDIEG
jgi:hypothetical protein